MNQKSGARITLYIVGVLHLVLASVLLYFTIDLTHAPGNDALGGMLIFLLAGLGGAVGVALLWKSGRVTWKSGGEKD